jgi:hypothetical protein
MKHSRRYASVSLVAGGFLALQGCAGTEPSPMDDPQPGRVISQVSVASESAPLRDYQSPGWTRWGDDQRERHSSRPLPDTFANATDPVVQSGAPSNMVAASTDWFEGVMIGQATGLRWHPPDTVGAVGPNDYVQAVNDGLGIYDKLTGAEKKVMPVNALWAGFGGPCEQYNDGDPTVNYDVLSDRWVVAQFAITATPYKQCVAVSTSSDPLGTWYRYEFDHGNTLFPDYPKLSVWPDAYYETFNLFTSRFAGAMVCAYDRSAMIAGQPVTQKCHQLGTSYGGLLASHVQSQKQAPPLGAPNYVMSLSSAGLNLWTFDFAKDTLTGPQLISIAPYTQPRKGVAQPGTRNRLDTLGDRLMYRLNYRNFGNHESLVVNHSVVTPAGNLGIRWYEVRSPGASPTLYQQSTFAPDGDSRWMGSVAMDKVGNIAVGYSVSSGTTYPSIRYATRFASDHLNQLTSETRAVDGQYAQTSSTRWGDYSSMTVDPTDDCTFYYTNEYLGSDGGWHTKIGHFKLSTCL